MKNRLKKCISPFRIWKDVRTAILMHFLKKDLTWTTKIVHAFRQYIQLIFFHKLHLNSGHEEAGGGPFS